MFFKYKIFQNQKYLSPRLLALPLFCFEQSCQLSLKQKFGVNLNHLNQSVNNLRMVVSFSK